MTLPTVVLDSILITIVNEAWENWDVAVADLPGAYLEVSMEGKDTVIMSLQKKAGRADGAHSTWYLPQINCCGWE